MAKRKTQENVEPATEMPLEEMPPSSGADQPAALPTDPGKEKKTFKDPFGIASDFAAGVQLLESRRYRQMQMRFNDKPSQPVLDAVKADGFRYNSQDKLWTKQIHQDTAMQTRIDAERLFQQVSGMIRQEKGVIERA